MKKLLPILLIMMISLSSFSQTSTTTYKVKRTSLLTYDADSIATITILWDTVAADTAAILAKYCGVKPPVDSLTATMYVDKWLSRLGIASEEDKTIAYAIQTEHNCLGMYSQSSVIGDPLLEIKQRAFNKKVHKAGLKLECEVSGSPASIASFLKFNRDCADPLERFDFVNAEWEPWNQPDLVAAAIKDTTQLKAQKIALLPTNTLGAEYWGWLKKFSSKFQQVLMQNIDYLPLHYYQSTPSISYHASELDSLNAIAKRLSTSSLKVVWDIKPIFSYETVFSDDEIKRLGSTRKLYSNWKLQFASKNYSNLKSTGYYSFAQSHLEACLPYKPKVGLLRSIFPKKYIQDSFINSTSEEHLKMSIPPGEE